MTKHSSLRSIKKRRKSVDKRGSAKKDRRKVNGSLIVEHHKTLNEDVRHEPSPELKENDKQSKEWFPWWSSSKLTDFYSWCQSTVTEVSK